MGQSIPVEVRLSSFEQLNDAVSGTDRSVVQLGRGQLRGHLTHLVVDDLAIDTGEFSISVRSRGVPSTRQLSLGMLTGCAGRVRQESREMSIGDVVVRPPNSEHDAYYESAASFVVISLSPEELYAFFAGDPRMQAATFRRDIFRAAPDCRSALLARLDSLSSRLRGQTRALSPHAARFWKRSIIEAMTAAILLSVSAEEVRSSSSALKIVRKVEDYLDGTGLVPVHISEICGALELSRRTLHRAFHDVLGMGPVTYLQRRRLCAINTILRRTDPRTTTIAEVALDHGYLNLGRFSGYYRSLFDEYPSETFGRSWQ
jgi:AraC-like DNA-binding protein